MFCDQLPPSLYMAVKRFSPYYLDVSTDSGFAEGNLRQIQGRFGRLLIFVRRKLQEKLKEEKEHNELRLFLLSILPSGAGNCLPTSVNVEEIFEAITRNKLWDYWNYHLLEQVIEMFGYDDEEMLTNMEQYKKNFSGYKIATKLKTHIAALDAETIALSAGATSGSNVPQTKPNPEYFSKLSLKLGEPVAGYSLDYLDKLWRSLRIHLLLPPLSLLLDTVHQGCVCVTWLIPSYLAPQAIERAQLSAEVFKGYQILEIKIDSKSIYNDEPADSEEKSVFSEGKVTDHRIMCYPHGECLI